MGQKLGAFLRVLGSGLSPQAFQANVGMYQQEKTEEATERQMNIKSAFASLGVLGASASKIKQSMLNLEEGSQEHNQALKMLHDISKQAATITKRFPKFESSMNESFLASMMEMDEVKPKELYGKPQAHHYTQESRRTYEKTGKQSDLVAREKDPLVQVNTGDRARLKATGAYAEGIGEIAKNRANYALSAQKQNTQLDRVLVAIDRGAATGALEEQLLAVKNFAQTIGFNIEGVAEQELIRTVSNEMALRLRNPESGLGLTGNTSNRDLQFLKDSVVGLGRSEEGNKKIIKLLQKFNKLTIDVAKEQDRIIMANGGEVPMNLNSIIMDYVDNYDFFTKEERASIDRIKREQDQQEFPGMSSEQIERLKKLRQSQGGY